MATLSSGVGEFPGESFLELLPWSCWLLPPSWDPFSKPFKKSGVSNDGNLASVTLDLTDLKPSAAASNISVAVSWTVLIHCEDLVLNSENNNPMSRIIQMTI